jgi:hypothetical protein
LSTRRFTIASSFFMSLIMRLRALQKIIFIENYQYLMLNLPDFFGAGMDTRREKRGMLRP